MTAGQMNFQDKIMDLPSGTRVWFYSMGKLRSITTQLTFVKKFCQERGWVIDRVFMDEFNPNKSTRHRENFEQMMDLSMKIPRMAELIVVWDFSRLARCQVDALLYQAQLCRYGWKILSLSGEIVVTDVDKIDACLDGMYERFGER